MAKKKRLMIMTVVKCKAFANIMKARIIKSREKRKRDEEEQKIFEARRKKEMERARTLEKLTKEDDQSTSQSNLSQGAIPPLAPLIASESVGSLLTMNN